MSAPQSYIRSQASPASLVPMLCHFSFFPPFSCSKYDNSLFTFHRISNTIYLLLYIDDIILMASSFSLISKVVSKLSLEFLMSDLGSLPFSLIFVPFTMLKDSFSHNPPLLKKFYIGLICSGTIPVPLLLTQGLSFLPMGVVFLILPYIRVLLVLFNI